MTEHTNYTLRIPRQQYDWIKDSAQKERRSIHSQILWLLDLGIQASLNPAEETTR